MKVSVQVSLLVLKHNYNSFSISYQVVFGRSGGLSVAIFLRRVQKGFSLQSLTQNLSSGFDDGGELVDNYQILLN